MAEGDERTLIVSAPEEALLSAVATDLQENPELNVGEMPFTVKDLTAITPDVGEPGTYWVR